jgi:hypothetical protein
MPEEDEVVELIELAETLYQFVIRLTNKKDF